MLTIRVSTRRHSLGGATPDQPRPVRLPGAEASESDVLTLEISGAGVEGTAVRVLVGGVPVASTEAADRVRPILPEDGPDGEARLFCVGRLLADWVGLTELAVDARPGDSPDWHREMVLPLAVAAGKMTMEQFNQLFAELQRDAAAALLDIHGKTQVGLRAGRAPVPASPVALLARLQATVADLDGLLQRIARQPASRLRVRTSREQALAGQAVSEATLAEALRDPGMLARRGRDLVFREHLREHSRPDFAIPEHQLLADFAEYLKAQLADLRQRIDLEVAERHQRRRFRDTRIDADRPTWWESEDLPRIRELESARSEVSRLYGRVERWAALEFLPPGRDLGGPPLSTPLFRNHALYRSAFRVLSGHFLTHQATLDTHQMLVRARSLPVLYEWWCAVRVIRVLTRGLRPLAHDSRDAGPVVSTQLTQQGRRFTIDFEGDQEIRFADARGAVVRFRYQPVYRPGDWLDAEGGSARVPDMTLEVYPRDTPDMPDLIIVLDAKYSARPQREKLNELAVKYAKIGDARTGRVLSRQVWALTPASPAGPLGRAGLRAFCTSDNRGFWSDDFDTEYPVNGAVQTRPTRPGEYDPLADLLETLLSRAGVEYAAADPVA